MDNQEQDNNEKIYRNINFWEIKQEEFKNMLSTLSENNKKVVLSYSNKALVPVDELEFIFNKLFKHVKLITTEYSHSSQGKGSAKLDEVVFVAYN